MNDTPSALTIACSTLDDGSMTGSASEVLPRRQAFLARYGIDMASTTLVQLVYNGDDYCRYATLDDNNKGDGLIEPSRLVADAMVVTKPGHALFLPLADCIGAVIHDPTKNVLMLSHLGRHNLEQFGGTKSVEYLMSEHGVDPRDLTVWLSPAASKNYYPLYSLSNRSLHDVAIEQLTRAGVLPEHITASAIDSAANTQYYSHSQFLQGKRPDDGRFAVVAMMA